MAVDLVWLDHLGQAAHRGLMEPPALQAIQAQVAHQVLRAIPVRWDQVVLPVLLEVMEAVVLLEEMEHFSDHRGQVVHRGALGQVQPLREQRVRPERPAHRGVVAVLVPLDLMVHRVHRGVLDQMAQVAQAELAERLVRPAAMAVVEQAAHRELTEHLAQVALQQGHPGPAGHQEQAIRSRERLEHRGQPVATGPRVHRGVQVATEVAGQVVAMGQVEHRVLQGRRGHMVLREVRGAMGVLEPLEQEEAREPVGRLVPTAVTVARERVE
jgi:hypothetical protein